MSTTGGGPDARPPEQVDGTKSNAPSTDNPVARGLNVAVLVPDTIEIRMVDASALQDYEVWILITSVLGSAVVGFVVALWQSSSSKDGLDKGLIMPLVVFAILMAISGAMLVSKRRKLTKKSRAIKLRATDASE